MKKRIISLVLLSAILVSSIVSMTACGSKEEEPTAYTETITTEIDPSVPNITEMTKAEILSLSADEIKQSVENYLPNYRTIYKIDENREMTDKDWKSLATIICIQLYGSATIENSESEESDTESHDIYVAPTYDDIYPMTLKEFALYMNKAVDTQYGEEYRTENEIDYTKLTDEELQSQKDALLDTLL